MSAANRYSVWVMGLATLGSLGASARLDAQESRKWTVEDVLLSESASDFQISPDGRWVAWVKSQMDKEEGERISNLYLSSLTESNEIQLTRGKATSSKPRWSPDGNLLTFLSTRDLPQGESKEGKDLSKSQLWAIALPGGEPWPLTTLERPIENYAWRGADSIVFAAAEDLTQYEQAIKEKKDTSQVVEDEKHTPPVRLFELTTKDKKIRRLTANNDWIDALAVSPDGRWAVTRHQRSLRFQYDNAVPPVTFLTDLATGGETPIFAGTRILSYDVVWTRDSKGFFVVSPYTTHPQYLMASISLLYYVDVESRQHREVDLGWEAGLGYGTVHATADGFIALLADGVRYKPARYVKNGASWTRAWIEGEHRDNLFAWELDDKGSLLVYEYSTASQPPQWYKAQLSGSRFDGSVRLTDLNSKFKEKPMPKSEIVSWIGSRNEKVDGVLHYPVNYEQGQRYPLILMIHGGPTGFDMDRWDLDWGNPVTLYAERGAFILKVNYHGSGNYPLEWVESIGGGNYYDLEVPDIEAGVDHLIERGLVDPDKLATMGWSNGAILTTALVTTNTRYKAASAGAGDVEWISDWGNVDFGVAFDNYYFGASPLDDPQLYIRKSPLFRLKNVTAPTILFTGTEDRNVPPSQSWSHFRALQQIGKTEVKLVLFPGEPHGLLKLVHQQRKVEEELQWFDRHLFGTYKEPNEALKKGSPLDKALRLARFPKVDGRYGAAHKGGLIPETVAHKGALIGRFEVTRAQFAAFDKNYRYAPGTENYPANGISFDQAQAYCSWLSKRTGKTYHLLMEEEARAIVAEVQQSENTLDFWAGYPPNVDDTNRLNQRLSELGGSAPLLKEVGSFDGLGEDPVFDLGGNVAEWVVAPDGTGKLAGGSADRPADSKGRDGTAGAAYRGFRVVEDAPR